MKTTVLLLILSLGLAMSTYAQRPTITLTFTADNNEQHVPLNSILIENLSQGNDTTLYAPDTVLVINYSTGIIEDLMADGKRLYVSQNYPNPMESYTSFSIYLTRDDEIFISISDIMGKMILEWESHLTSGQHTFTFFPGNQRLYFLTVSNNSEHQTIKMFNSADASFGSSNCKLEYNDMKQKENHFKSGNMATQFGFALGDQLRYTAFTSIGERIITSVPAGDHTYYFHFTGESCSETPYVTDMDGNTYNTIQIGDQCWMKENLKTTVYSNGTPIPHVEDSAAWTTLSTGAYVWYENDISWKDIYGGLYNWFTTIDQNGLCPSGWHVPSDDEWKIMTNFIGGTLPPHGFEIRSCRQENSPMGGECNTNEHPRWDEDASNYGTDNYGFSGLPAGYRFSDAGFYAIGSSLAWWTTTEKSATTSWGRLMNYYNGHISEGSYAMTDGFSVRCVRNY